ncbi:helix-turn-helix domain-containing protein [Halomicrococcus gelatinilyticus]|uniref:helix-turn-helix domain-containing protein n=1 Tax=Halomicrococcus gelatinilyticus TaxID=1702103 RepID=UPI002E0DB930
MSDDVAELLELLDDEYARTILVETHEEPMAADALADACDASPSTVYRRIERLKDQRLLEAEQRLDPDGHHHEVYSACLQRATVEVTTDGFQLEVDRTEDPADRFTKLYEGFKG